MAVFETPRALSEGVRTTKITLFSRLHSLVLDWNDRRVTRNALQKLSARELDDIGLSRNDIANL